MLIARALLIFLGYISPLMAETPCQIPTHIITELTQALPITKTVCAGEKLSLEFMQKNNTPIEIPIPFSLFEEKHIFYGLAQLYNGSRPVMMNDQKQVTDLILPFEGQLIENTWVGFKGRFKTFLVSASAGQFFLTDNTLRLHVQENLPIRLHFYLGTAQGEFEPIRYAYLWDWLSLMCQAFEAALIFLYQILGSWGTAIITLAVLLKLFLLPLSMWMQTFQAQVNAYQAILEPKLRDIKQHWDGEEAHKRIMAEYKQLGITPFYTLKPLWGVFIQIPILVAVSNVLGEMSQFAGISFLWIADLSHPDTIATLPFSIPLFGNEINISPFIMTFCTLIAVLCFKNYSDNIKLARKQQYHLYMMVGGFFILLYPFPAAMVLFWAVTNFLQCLQQKISP